ncbi:RimK family alpha-L-glutamate ligase [Candidatus Uhrbacteria bacterium]|jgi:ribosomal protein S6--L-glutamate ligase|nr:RimK family alpha-L-glutamate ligase [Candidatus Uhrbacteria bacterium]
MRIGILSFQTRNFENYSSVDQLADRITANGHEATIILVAELELQFGSKTEVLLKGKPLPLFDILIVRPRIIADPSIATTYMRALETSGQKLLNGPNPVFFTKNKLETLRRLSDAGIPVPKTSTISKLDELDSVMAGYDFPVVIKTIYGSHGTGVFLAESHESLRPIVDFQINRGQFNDPITIQEYIAEAKNSDLRAFVVDERVVAAMRRTAPNGDFRANYTRGGSIEAVDLTDEQKSVAVAAANALELDYAGVDILEASTGPVVIEVNSNPGFTGIMEATGVDVADEIVKLAIARATK